MPSVHDALFLDAFRALLAVQGVAIDYTPAGSAALSRTALWAPLPSEDVDGDDGAFNRARGELEMLNDADDGVTAPARGDVVGIGGSNYRVEKISQPSGVWLLELALIVVREKSSSSNRIRRT